MKFRMFSSISKRDQFQCCSPGLHGAGLGARQAYARTLVLQVRISGQGSASRGIYDIELQTFYNTTGMDAWFTMNTIFPLTDNVHYFHPILLTEMSIQRPHYSCLLLHPRAALHSRAGSWSSAAVASCSSHAPHRPRPPASSPDVTTRTSAHRSPRHPGLPLETASRLPLSWTLLPLPYPIPPSPLR